MFIEINGHDKKMERFRINNLIICLKDTEKQGENKTRSRKWKERKDWGSK